jgi:hypothetical protein
MVPCNLPGMNLHAWLHADGGAYGPGHYQDVQGIEEMDRVEHEGKKGDEACGLGKTPTTGCVK